MGTTPSPITQMKIWVHEVNRLVSRGAVSATGTARPARRAASMETSEPEGGALWHADPPAAAGGPVTYRFSSSAADALVRRGLKPIVIDQLAKASHLPSADLQRFAGVDRTTVKRRADKGQALPQDAAVKTLTAAELVGQATEVFGSVEDASEWLITPHPMLQGETPMQRARTPWGLEKVREILVALRYGGVV